MPNKFVIVVHTALLALAGAGGQHSRPLTDFVGLGKHVNVALSREVRKSKIQGSRHEGRTSNNSTFDRWEKLGGFERNQRV